MRITTLSARISALAAAAALGMFTSLAGADSPDPEGDALDFIDPAAETGALAHGAEAPALDPPMQFGGAGLGADLFRQEAEALLDIARTADPDADGGPLTDEALADVDMLDILDIVEAGSDGDGDGAAAAEGGAALSDLGADLNADLDADLGPALADAAFDDQALGEQAMGDQAMGDAVFNDSAVSASMRRAPQTPLDVAGDANAPAFDDLGVNLEEAFAGETDILAEEPEIVVADAADAVQEMYGDAPHTDDALEMIDLTNGATPADGEFEPRPTSMAEAVLNDLRAATQTPADPTPASAVAAAPTVEQPIDAPAHEGAHEDAQEDRGQIVYQGPGGSQEPGETVYTAVSDADAPGETVYVAGGALEEGETIYVARRVLSPDPEPAPEPEPVAARPPAPTPAPLSAADRADAVRHHDLNRASAAAARAQAAIMMAAPRRAPPRPMYSAPTHAPAPLMIDTAPAAAHVAPAAPVYAQAPVYAPTAAPVVHHDALATARQSQVAVYIPARAQSVAQEALVYEAPAYEAPVVYETPSHGPAVSVASAPAAEPYMSAPTLAPGWTPPSPSLEVAVVSNGAAYSAAAAHTLHTVSAPISAPVSPPVSAPVQTVLTPGWTPPGPSQEVATVRRAHAHAPAMRTAVRVYRPAAQRSVRMIQRPAQTRRVARRIIRRRLIHPSAATTVCAPRQAVYGHCPR